MDASIFTSTGASCFRWLDGEWLSVNSFMVPTVGYLIWPYFAPGITLAEPGDIVAAKYMAYQRFENNLNLVTPTINDRDEIVFIDHQYSEWSNLNIVTPDQSLHRHIAFPRKLGREMVAPVLAVGDIAIAQNDSVIMSITHEGEYIWDLPYHVLVGDDDFSSKANRSMTFDGAWLYFAVIENHGTDFHLFRVPVARLADPSLTVSGVEWLSKTDLGLPPMQVMASDLSSCLTGATSQLFFATQILTTGVTTLFAIDNFTGTTTLDLDAGLNLVTEIAQDTIAGETVLVIGLTDGTTSQIRSFTTDLTPLWTLELDSPIGPTLCIGNDHRIFAITTSTTRSDSLISFRPFDGTELWTGTHTGVDWAFDLESVSTATVFDGYSTLMADTVIVCAGHRTDASGFAPDNSDLVAISFNGAPHLLWAIESSHTFGRACPRAIDNFLVAIGDTTWSSEDNLKRAPMLLTIFTGAQTPAATWVGYRGNNNATASLFTTADLLMPPTVRSRKKNTSLPGPPPMR